jgi:CheY-like chemotaxis protein
MPVLDGYQCAEKIIKNYTEKQFFFCNDQNNVNCPLLVACSALINKEIDQKAKKSGFDFCV